MSPPGNRVPAPVAPMLRAAFRSVGPPGHQFSLRYDPPVRFPGFRNPIPGFEGDWLAAFDNFFLEPEIKKTLAEGEGLSPGPSRGACGGTAAAPRTSGGLVTPRRA